MKKFSFWRYLTVAIMLALIGISILVQIVRIQNSPEVAGVTGQGAYIWKTSIQHAAKYTTGMAICWPGTKQSMKLAWI